MERIPKMLDEGRRDSSERMMEEESPLRELEEESGDPERIEREIMNYVNNTMPYIMLQC